MKVGRTFVYPYHEASTVYQSKSGVLQKFIQYRTGIYHLSRLLSLARVTRMSHALTYYKWTALSVASAPHLPCRFGARTPPTHRAGLPAPVAFRLPGARPPTSSRWAFVTGSSTPCTIPRAWRRAGRPCSKPDSSAQRALSTCCGFSSWLP